MPNLKLPLRFHNRWKTLKILCWRQVQLTRIAYHSHAASPHLLKSALQVKIM